MSTGRPRVEVSEQDRDLWKIAATRVRVAQALFDLYGDPAAGSQLAADDARCRVVYLSDAVREYLAAALDNLALWTNVVMPKVFIEGVAVENPPRPYFTLARAGLDSAAQASWILFAADSEERLARHRRLAVDDLNNMRLVAKLIDDGAKQAVKDRIDALHASTDDRIKGAPNFLDMVRAASPIVGTSADDAEVLWRTASAAAHGKPWFLEATHSADIAEEFAGGRYRAVRLPDAGMISAVVTLAAEVTDRAVLQLGHLLGAPLGDLIPLSLRTVAADRPRSIAPPGTGGDSAKR